MPTQDEWIVIGLLLGLVAVVGIGIFVSRKKPSPRIKLRPIKPILSNLERRKITRDKEGNISEILIIREVKAHE